jgi:hypothetical protein
MSLVPRNRFLNKSFSQILNHFLLPLTLTSQLILNIPLQLKSILETSNTLDRLILNKLRIYKILLIRAHISFIMILPSHLDIISDLTEGFPIEIFRLDFWNIACVPWDMPISTMGHTFGMVVSFVFGYKASVSRNHFIIFLLSDHFKFLDFIMGKLPCRFFVQGRCNKGD